MLAALAIAVLSSSVIQEQAFLTRAERSSFLETSTYDDVIAFMRIQQTRYPSMILQWTGVSTEGRKVPLAIVSWPEIPTPDQARRSGKPIVYIQANIHAGEVEGKEAAQSLLRRLCTEALALSDPLHFPKPTNSLVDKFVFLIDPIYNADGNEKWGPVERNRPEQDGPAKVGVRANGQNLDLNRDCIKAESPEMRGALAEVYTKWDPDVIFDLHTTDGTRHGFELTYSPPLNPVSDPGILAYSRDELLPWVRNRFRRDFGQELFDYGNAARSGENRRWETFGHEGRYVTNYAGLRNRIGILSEATTYIPFEARVVATERFVTLCLIRLATQAERVVSLTRAADRRMADWSVKGPNLGVRFEMASRGKEKVPLEKPPGKREKRPDAVVWTAMPIFDRFKPTKTSKFPWAYLLPAESTATVELLQRHGVLVEQLAEPWNGPVDRFRIDKATQAGTAFQGHRLWTLDGGFVAERSEWPTGTVVVRTAQPLGSLIFHILEPESTDGAAAWGFMGDFQGGKLYPAAKAYQPVQSAREVLTPVPTK
ncbi:MAG: M14 family metallopeptidase [Fimbriimonadaceae bacterium]|nr:M14 family metallopeptidase [Fimbriimonadaceae bacterium]